MINRNNFTVVNGIRGCTLIHEKGIAMQVVQQALYKHILEMDKDAFCGVFTMVMTSHGVPVVYDCGLDQLEIQDNMYAQMSPIIEAIREIAYADTNNSETQNVTRGYVNAVSTAGPRCLATDFF